MQECSGSCHGEDLPSGATPQAGSPPKGIAAPPADLNPMKTPTSIYIHIPFCEVKCGYCDFYSVPRGWEEFELQERYVEALRGEIDRRYSTAAGPVGPTVQSIFFGGGTPSLLRPDLIEKILAHLQKYFSWDQSCEITLETNPKTVSLDKLKTFRSLGINRLSIGVQSFQDRYLKFLGRIHSGQEARTTVTDAFAAGFENINCDLIFSLPGQTLSEWKQDLETALSLETTHLSCYNLTIEPGTPFARLYENSDVPVILSETKDLISRDSSPPRAAQNDKAGTAPLPDNETALQQFEWTRQHLQGTGLPAYEISNFARPGFECLHNLNYWRYGEYWGFGTAASSFTYFERRNNARDLKDYLTKPHRRQDPMGGTFEIDVITKEMAQGEFVMLGLRTREGISLSRYQELFKESFETTDPNWVKKCLKNEWVVLNGSSCRLTESGVKVADSIIAEFRTPSVAERSAESHHDGNTPLHPAYRSGPSP